MVSFWRRGEVGMRRVSGFVVSETRERMKGWKTGRQAVMMDRFCAIWMHSAVVQ